MSRNDFLVVIDPTRDEQPALQRAIESAQLTGMRLNLFECVNGAYAAGLEGSDDEIRAAILERSGARLASYMNQASNTAFTHHGPT